MGGVWEAEWWNHCEGFVLLEGTRCEASEQKLGDGVWASALTAEEVCGCVGVSVCVYVCTHLDSISRYVFVYVRLCTYVPIEIHALMLST